MLDQTLYAGGLSRKGGLVQHILAVVKPSSYIAHKDAGDEDEKV